jgi:DNA-binding response OmpR family regulator
LLESKHYDLITVSYRFAVTNGVDMIRLIREIKHRKETPVLMVTGSPNVTQEALAAGANEVLIKPIEPSSLVAAVKRHTESTVAQENDEARLRGMRGYWKRGKSLSIATCNLTGKPH